MISCLSTIRKLVKTSCIFFHFLKYSLNHNWTITSSNFLIVEGFSYMKVKGFMGVYLVDWTIEIMIFLPIEFSSWNACFLNVLNKFQSICRLNCWVILLLIAAVINMIINFKLDNPVYKLRHEVGWWPQNLKEWWNLLQSGQMILLSKIKLNYFRWCFKKNIPVVFGYKIVSLKRVRKA